MTPITDPVPLFAADLICPASVFPRPDSFRPKAVPIQHPDNRFGDRFAVIHGIAWNLPKPAAVEVAPSLLNGRMQQQKLNACAAPLEHPDVKNIRRETHGRSSTYCG
jgi:hypothetical protein